MSLYLTSKNIKNYPWIWDFLESEREKGILIWEEQNIYQFQNQYFQFATTIFVRERKNHGYAYEMESPDILGSGSFATVAMSLVTLSQGKDEAGFQAENKSRVIKKQPQPFALDEYARSKAHSHLHIKKPTEGRIVLKNLGLTTTEFLSNYLSSMTLPDRVALSKAILQAYNQQLVEPQIGHNDLYRNNILIKTTANSKNKYQVNIIDYAFARTIPSSETDKTPDFACILFILQDLWQSKSMPQRIANLLNDEIRMLKFSEWQHCFNDLLISPTALCQEPIDNLESFFEKLKGSHQDLAAQLRSIISEALKLSTKDDLKPLKKGVLSCLNQLKINKINTPRFPIAVFDTDSTKQSLYNKIENYYQHIEAKGNFFLPTHAHEEGHNLCEALNDLNSKTLEAIYTPKASQKNQIEICQQSCKNLLKKNKYILETHRNFNYIWAELALIVCSLIVLYPLIIAINYGINGRIGFFSQTKSMIKGRKLEDNFEQLKFSLN